MEVAYAGFEGYKRVAYPDYKYNERSPVGVYIFAYKYIYNILNVYVYVCSISEV